MKPGNIILLNGTSSAGKTTLTKALQEILDEPYLHTGIDHFLESAPQQRLFVYTDETTAPNAEGWLLIFRDGVLGEAPRLGPTALQLLNGMYQAIAALANAGVNVIVDDVIYDPRVLHLAATGLSERNALFVGVHCPLAVAIQREQARGNRAGGAAIFHPLVHAHGLYDLEVDTSLHSVQACAEQIKAALQNNLPRTALRQLKQNALLP